MFLMSYFTTFFCLLLFVVGGVLLCFIVLDSEPVHQGFMKSARLVLGNKPPKGVLHLLLSGAINTEITEADFQFTVSQYCQMLIQCLPYRLAVFRNSQNYTQCGCSGGEKREILRRKIFSLPRTQAVTDFFISMLLVRFFFFFNFTILCLCTLITEVVVVQVSFMKMSLDLINTLHRPWAPMSSPFFVYSLVCTF